MTQSLAARLDQLHGKVDQLAKALSESRLETQKARQQLGSLTSENEALRRKLNEAQGQINKMINQWFPELELNAEDSNGSN